MAERKSLPFTFTVSGTFSQETDDEDRYATITLELLASGDTTGSKTHQFKIPLPVFKNPSYYNDWLKSTINRFLDNAGDTLLHELVCHLLDEANYTMLEMKLVSASLRSLLDGHVSSRERFLRRKYGVPKAGRSSKWTAGELRMAVSNALTSLKPAMRSYNKVAEALKETHPEKAPATGEALRKLIDHFDINWKSLKAEVKNLLIPPVL